MASRKRVAIALEDEGCLILGASRRTSDHLNKSWKGSVGANTCALQQVECKGSCGPGGITSRKRAHGKSAHGKSAHGKSAHGKSVRGKSVRGKISRKAGTKPGSGGPSSDAGSDAGGSSTRRSTRPGKRKRERPRKANPADDPGAVAVGVLDVKEGPGAAAGSRGVGPTRRQHAAAASAAVAVTVEAAAASEEGAAAHVSTAGEGAARINVLDPGLDSHGINDLTDPMLAHYRDEEGRCAISATSYLGSYMERQTGINAKMRAILVDWLVDVHIKFKFKLETHYLTVYLIDRFLEQTPTVVAREELQLVGVTALLLSSKYEEIYPPEIRELVYITDKAYTRAQVRV